MRRAGPLGRCLGEFIPCVGICEWRFCLVFLLYIADSVGRCREIDHGCVSLCLRVCFVVCSVRKYCAQNEKCAECFFECAFERRGTRFHPGVESTFSHLLCAARASWVGGSSRSGYPQRIRGRPNGLYIIIIIIIIIASSFCVYMIFQGSSIGV